MRCRERGNFSVHANHCRNEKPLGSESQGVDFLPVRFLPPPILLSGLASLQRLGSGLDRAGFFAVHDGRIIRVRRRGLNRV